MNDSVAVASVWNERRTSGKEAPDRFWLFPEITSHINMRLCGEPLTGVASGMHRRLQALGPFSHAISVGCGTASKERALLKAGIVQHFDLFDFADTRLARAKEALGPLANRATLVCGDAFDRPAEPEYDLVYWHSSLHHMPDAHAAVEWSLRVLKPGGLFAFWEFTGPTRFQWSDANLEITNRFRQNLPERLSGPLRGRPSISTMIARDPSEAADSDQILPAIRNYFPDAEIIPLGGALYNNGLTGIYPKLQLPEDQWVLRQMLLVDDILIEAGENHFHAGFARKPRSAG